MAKVTDVTALLGQVNDVTNAIAANVGVVADHQSAELALIESLKAQLAQGGTITEADLDPLAANAQARIDALAAVQSNLAAVAASGDAPVPEVTPVELPPAEPPQQT